MGWKQIPSTPQQIEARNILMDALRTKLNFPSQQIVGLSPEEESNLSLLYKSLTQGSTGEQTAMNEINRILGGEYYDPNQDQYYRGVRDELSRLKGEAVQATGARAQQAGMYRSSTGVGMEAKTGREYDSALMQVLGSLSSQERDRRMTATGMASDIGQRQTQNLMAGQQVLSLPRMIEQARADADYNELLQELLAPYEYQLPIANTILGEQQFYYKKKSSSGLGSALGTAIGTAIGGPIGGTIGGYVTS